MLNKIKFVFDLMDAKSRVKILVFSFFRMFIGLIDLLSVLLIGILLAKTVSSVSTENSNQGSKLMEYLSFFQQFSVIQLALIATVGFISKSIISAILTKIMLNNFVKIEVDLANQAFRYMMKNIAWTTKNYSKSDINFLLKTSTASTIQMISAFVIVISEFFFLLLMFISFFIVDPGITFFIVVYFLGIAIFLHGFLGKRFKANGIKSVNNEVAGTTVIYDTIQSFREVVAFKKQNYFLNKFEKNKFNVSKASFDIQFLSAIPRYVVESSLLVGALGIIYLSLKSGNLEKSAETIGIFLTGSMKMMTSLLPLQTYFAQFKNQLEISNKYLDFQKHVEGQETKNNLEPTTQQVFANGAVGIKVTNLNFDYGDQFDSTLKNISFEIKPGQVAALIGPSGSGKSTLADLLIGIHDCKSGIINFFDSSYKKIERSNVQFGYVPQNPGKIYGTIKENIAFGIDEQQVDLKSLNSALELAHLDEVISNLEFGFETHTGEQSEDLSGGQMQRIGLARALYVKPNFLILDEATSALDVDTESAVSSSLENLRGKCTSLIIAHRLSTIKNADVIFVLDQGQIIAQGTFSELAKSNEIVSRFVELSELSTR